MPRSTGDRFIPSREDLATIRSLAPIAARRAGYGLSDWDTVLEAGLRHHIGPDPELYARGAQMNVLRASALDGGDWSDTDLADHRSWKEVCSGFELTADGRAVIDLWVYVRETKRRDRDLVCQLQAHFAPTGQGTRLVRITTEGTNGVLWDREMEAA